MMSHAASRIGTRDIRRLAMLLVCGCLVVCSYLLVTCGRSTGVNADSEAGPPRRICSLTLATDEILAALVDPERMVAVTRLVDDPAFSNATGFFPSSVPRLAALKFERIVETSPDLVCVAPYITKETLESLGSAGLPVFKSRATDSLDGIMSNIGELAKRVGEEAAGKRLLADLEQRRQALRSRLETCSRRPRILAWTNGYCYAPKTTVDDVMREAGGRNAIADLGVTGCVQIPDERIIEADPDILLLEGKDGAATGRLTSAMASLRAARGNAVIRLEGRHYSTMSQHVIVAIENLHARLHADCCGKDGG